MASDPATASGPIAVAELWPLELYEERREAFRSRAMAERAVRRVAIGEHLTLLFENRLTIFYQIMEMLRSEKMIDQASRQHELDSYNPLISDAGNLRATLLVEYAERAERDAQLRVLHGLERQLWLGIGAGERSMAIANEDQTYQMDEGRTAAVHYLRYPLSAAMRRAADAGATICCGAEHPHYACDSGALPAATRRALQADLRAGVAA